MFGRKKKDATDATVEPGQDPNAEIATEAENTEENPAVTAASVSAEAAPVVEVAPAAGAPSSGAVAATPAKSGRGNRVQKVGIVYSDKMQKTVVVRVDRLVMHMKYRRYVRRTTKFKAHNEMGAVVGDRVRIVETRPLSAQKRWRVVEIVQKAAK